MKNKFKFSTNRLDLTKAETEDYFEIEGLASTDDPDLEDEIIKQNFDLSAIKINKGYLNDDHGHNYENKDHARLGVIDEAEIRPEGLWIKGKVWKKHPAATAYYNELKHKPGMVQFSVEGYTVKRNPFANHVVEKAVALGVALTRNPINDNTFAQLAKSLNAGKTQIALEKASAMPLIQGFNIVSDPSTATITITQTVDPTHPNWEDYQDQILDLAKGGMGSGKKTHKIESLAEKERAMQGQQKEIKREHAVSNIVVAQAKQKDQEPEAPEKNKEEAQNRRRMELQAERTRARQSGDKEALKRIKKKTEKFSTRKRVRKSTIQAELIRRAQQDPVFKSKLEELLNKALSSGGAAYADTLPGDFTQGQVFQQESLNTHAKDKKCKKCKKGNINCKCK